MIGPAVGHEHSLAKRRWAHVRMAMRSSAARLAERAVSALRRRAPRNESRPSPSSERRRELHVERRRRGRHRRSCRLQRLFVLLLGDTSHTGCSDRGIPAAAAIDEGAAVETGAREPLHSWASLSTSPLPAPPCAPAERPACGDEPRTPSPRRPWLRSSHRDHERFPLAVEML